MKTTKLNDTEISESSVASLPTRPNAPYAFGGNGLTADALKAAFDALPLLIAERLNSLIDDIKGENGGSIADTLKTGLNPGHTFSNLMEDVTGGQFITYLQAPSGSVCTYLLSLRADIDRIAKAVGVELEVEK